MSATSPAKTETTYSDEGVVVTRSATGLLIYLPRPISANHQFSIVATLWDVCTGARNNGSGARMDWTINISAFEEFPLPLIAVISAVDAHLRQAGRKVSIVGNPHPPSLAIRKL